MPLNKEGTENLNCWINSWFLAGSVVWSGKRPPGEEINRMQYEFSVPSK